MERKDQRRKRSQGVDEIGQVIRLPPVGEQNEAWVGNRMWASLVMVAAVTGRKDLAVGLNFGGYQEVVAVPVAFSGGRSRIR